MKTFAKLLGLLALMLALALPATAQCTEDIQFYQTDAWTGGNFFPGDQSTALFNYWDWDYWGGGCSDGAYYPVSVTFTTTNCTVVEWDEVGMSLTIQATAPGPMSVVMHLSDAGSFQDDPDLHETILSTTVYALQPGVLALKAGATPADAGKATSGYFLTSDVLNQDMTVSVTLKRGPWYVRTNDAGYYIPAPYLRLVDAQGRVRFSYGQNSSPWGEVTVGNGLTNQPTVEFEKGTLGRIVYDTYTFCVKQPTATANGYLRVYMNGDMIKTAGNILYDIPIPSQPSDPDWFDWTGGNCRIEVGGPTYPNSGAYKIQDLKVADILLWNRCLDTDVAQVGLWNPYHYWGTPYPRMQSASVVSASQSDFTQVPANDPLRQGLVAHVRSTTDRLTRIVAGSAAPQFLTRTGAASVSTDVPASYGATYTTVPYVYGLGAVTATGPTSLNIAAIYNGLSSGPITNLPVKRTLYVTRSTRYKDVYDYKEVLAPGTIGNKAITGLPYQGTLYRVYVEYEDVLGNTTVVGGQAVTTGAWPGIPTATGSVQVSGRTNTRMPAAFLPSDEGLTIRCWVRRNAGDGVSSSATRTVFGLTDALNDTTGGSGYQRLALVMDGYGKLIARTVDGDLPAYPLGDVDGPTLPENTWTEVWMTMKPPTLTTTGSITIRVGNNATQTRTFAVATNRFSDMHWKKQMLHMAIGAPDEFAPALFNVSAMSVWTRVLTEAEQTGMLGRDIANLSGSVRCQTDLAFHWAPVYSAGATSLVSAGGVTTHNAVGINGTITLGTNAALVTDTPPIW